MTILLFLLGLALLVVGAELLVRGAATLARRLGIPSLIVGLTVVAYGTSAPELAVSTKAALAGSADLALGNVVGSNIFNVLFILGVSSLILPLAVSRQLIRLDVPLMIGVSLLAWVLVLDGNFSRAEGVLFFLGAVVYTVVLVMMGRREAAASGPEEGAPPKSAPGIARDLVLAVAGLALLVLGARWLVDSSITIARAIGVSELIIAVTVVAAGTSLPEVATSITAALRGERDIAVGNVVGSNIFNLLCVLGGAAALSPEGVGVSSAALAFDVPMMVLTALLCLPIFFTGAIISRHEGALFLGLYVAYVAILIVGATAPGIASLGRAVLFFGIFPAVGIALVMVSLAQVRRRGAHGA